MIFDLIRRLFSTAKPVNRPMPVAVAEQPLLKVPQTEVVPPIPAPEQTDSDRLSLATSFNSTLSDYLAYTDDQTLCIISHCFI